MAAFPIKIPINSNQIFKSDQEDLIRFWNLFFRKSEIKVVTFAVQLQVFLILAAAVLYIILPEDLVPDLTFPLRVKNRMKFFNRSPKNFWKKYSTQFYKFSYLSSSCEFVVK